MTTVHIDFRIPAADGSLTPATGHLRFTPTQRRTASGATVLAVSFQKLLVDGTADVVLAPTDDSWAWRIEEMISAAPNRTIYAAVPDAETLAYADLVPLDPLTMSPSPGLAPAWAEPIAEMDSRLSAGTITPDPDDPGFFLIGA
jgi:hypothetical protein